MRVKHLEMLSKKLRAGDVIGGVGTVLAVNISHRGLYVTIEDRLGRVRLLGGDVLVDPGPWLIDRPVPSRNTKMDVVMRNRRRWVKALRSGNYEQGKRYLHVANDGAERFCCLGVGCDLVQTGWVPTRLYEQEAGVFVTGTTHSQSIPDPADLAPFGINSAQANDLAIHNDDGWNFDEIADLIENDPHFAPNKDVLAAYTWRQLARR